MKLLLKLFFGTHFFVILQSNYSVASSLDHASHINIQNNNKIKNDEQFSKSVKNLPFVKKAQVVKLKNGDSYTIIATMNKQKINNKIIKRFAYNGTIPGPFIEIEKGSNINIKFINKTDTDQTLHSHGVRLNYQFDGVPYTDKQLVKPGQTFNYKINFPDVGVFWYHPHVREDYSQDMGLYGNYIVKSNDNKFSYPINQYVPLILDDILLEKSNIEFFKNYTNYAAMGRYGNIMLINNNPNFSMEANEGDIVRFYLTNTANTRTFNIKIPDAKIKLIASDASNFEKETWVDNIIISPSERYIIDVLFQKSGKYLIQNSIPNKTYNMGIINVRSKKSLISYNNQFLNLNVDKNLEAELKKLKPLFDKQVDKEISLSVSMDMNHNDHNSLSEIEWEDNMPEMNANMTSNDVVWELIETSTKKKNMEIFWTFKKDNYYKIKIFNDPKSNHPMQHPIHFHGQRFLVLSENGIKNTNMAWKDTVLVKTGKTIEILLEASNIGKWMAHCHISEHLSSGMMLGFEVVN